MRTRFPRHENPSDDTNGAIDRKSGGVREDVAAALTVRGVGMRFATRRGGAIEALRDVNFDVAPGEFVSIVGPSGCGKSTLLMLVAGLETPTNGEVLVNDRPVTGPSSVMGVAFQRDNLMSWRTVLGNVLSQVDLRGWRRSEWTDRAMSLLDMVGLSDFHRSYPRELSGGMRQRVSLCRALLHHPRLLLLDEPFGAVDAMTREQLNIDVGRVCAASGVTTLLVTHDINEAAFMGDRVVVMRARPGRVAGVVTVPTATPRPSEFRGSQEFLDATVNIRHELETSYAASAAPERGEVLTGE